MLQEYTTPGDAAAVRDDETIFSLLTERLERTGDETVIASRKTGPGSWANITTGEFHHLVRDAAKGFMAFGIERGAAVTIFSPTRWEWGVIDFALAAIGAVSVPIYDTDSAAQAKRILIDSDVKLAIADDEERFHRLYTVMNDCPSLRRILMLDNNALGALQGLGASVTDIELNRRIAEGRADDLATIVYTSGSTGAPKGAELTHRNFVSVVRAASTALHEMILDNHPRLLLFLPLAHCFARFIQYASIASDDGVVGYLPDTRSLLPDLRSFQPTYLLGVPRVFEKVYNAASRKAGTGLKGRLFAQAAEAARDWSRTEQAGGKPTARQITQRALFETAVYRTVRGALGPKIRYVACGGAPLSLDLAHRAADDPGLRHDGNGRPLRRHPRRRQCDRHRRPARSGFVGSHFRGRRAAGQRAERVPRIPQSARQDPRGLYRGRLAAHRRSRRDRRRGTHHHHRPHQGHHHHCRRKERLADPHGRGNREVSDCGACRGGGRPASLHRRRYHAGS